MPRDEDEAPEETGQETNEKSGNELTLKDNMREFQYDFNNSQLVLQEPKAKNRSEHLKTSFVLKELPEVAAKDEPTKASVKFEKDEARRLDAPDRNTCAKSFSPRPSHIPSDLKVISCSTCNLFKKINPRNFLLLF